MKHDDCAVQQNTNRLDEMQRENDALRHENGQLRQQLQWLIEQVKLGRHKQFGASSEQTSPGQLQLHMFNEAEIYANTTFAEPEIEQVKAHYRKKPKTAEDRLPPDLPVEIVEHELPSDKQTCSCCGHGMHVMGHETREELKLVPAKAVIVRHIRSVYACRHCEQHSDSVPIVKADMPVPVIKGGFASPEAIAYIAVQKFVMGSPLYRQEHEWNRQDIQLSRQTMSNWLVKASNDWLEPIYAELKRRLLQHGVLHADETTLQVLHESGKPAQSKSYMWLYRTSGITDRHIVLYDYKPDRKAAHPEAFLKDFTGYLHADGYDGYHRLFESITVVGCWAHLRRKFDELLKTLKPGEQTGSDAVIGIAYCDRLFHIEKRLASMPPEQRKMERDRLSRPVVDEFYAWVESAYRTAMPKTLIGRALHYAKSQKRYLLRYLLDGRLEISNNRAERSIKPFVIGRKNWLFANTPNGARASAVYYSLIETAKENGIDPYGYLAKVFRAAPNLGTGEIIDDLLPWN